MNLCINNFILFSNTLSTSLAKISLNSFSFYLSEITVKFFMCIKKITKLYLFDHNVIDYPSLKKRFLIYYGLLSYFFRKHLVFLTRKKNTVTTLTKVYPSSEWLERESFDFFGIFYNNHPDLRRILTDYGFPSYALRKDFPVTGYFDLVYSISLKKIQFKEIEFQQAYRVFLKENPYNA